MRALRCCKELVSHDEGRFLCAPRLAIITCSLPAQPKQPHHVQDSRRGPINAPVADVNVFNEVVQAFNEREGVVPADGETPIAAASQQVQQDAASFLGHIVDALHDETCALRARVEPPAQAEGDDDEDGWLQVHSCSCCD